jgi:hypothetical protein
MVPTLIYLLFKKLRKQDWRKIKRNFFSRLFIRSNQIILSLVILLLLISFVLSAQPQMRNYKVMRKGHEIGWVSILRTIDSNAVFFNFASEIRTSFLFTFSSSAREMSEFRDGTLRHSYFYRKMNGNIKTDRHTRLIGSNYEVQNKSEKTKLDIVPVTFNTLCMYFQEPIGREQVYSDNFQRFLDINRASDGAYTISYDGTSNSFYYSNGICNKVEINSTFYSATLLLK